MKEKNDFVDFSDTKVAFAHKSDAALKKAIFLFNVMSKKWLVDLLGTIGGKAVSWGIPFTRKAVKSTIYSQFVGGETLVECQDSIDLLERNRILTVLDYGAEGKSAEEDLDEAAKSFKTAVTFAASNDSVPVVSVKISALADNRVLEEIQQKKVPSQKIVEKFEKVKLRIDGICAHAYSLGVKIFIDAEESWIQDTIDDLVNDLMMKYNQERVIVYNTFQMYRHDRYAFLESSYEHAEQNGYFLGAKLVRGAYMEKERERAERLKYPSPIHKTKADCDADYQRAIKFCVDRYERLASCAATHNTASCLYQAQLIGERNLPRNHPHLNFCQLYGMGDNLTFNLADSGYNVAKYVVFGEVKEVLPYLIRRAEENTAVKGEFTREYQLLVEELERRRLEG